MRHVFSDYCRVYVLRRLYHVPSDNITLLQYIIHSNRNVW